MSKHQPDLSKSEWGLMKYFWKHPKLSVREAHQLTQSNHMWAYTTVKTMMDRLVDKGYLKREKTGMIFYYSATISIKTATTHYLDNLVNRFLDGTFGPVVTYLADHHSLSSDEIQALKNIIKHYESKEKSHGTVS